MLTYKTDEFFQSQNHYKNMSIKRELDVNFTTNNGIHFRKTPFWFIIHIMSGSKNQTIING